MRHRRRYLQGNTFNTERYNKRKAIEAIFSVPLSDITPTKPGRGNAVLAAVIGLCLIVPPAVALAVVLFDAFR